MFCRVSSDTLACFLVLLVHTGTGPCRTHQMVKVLSLHISKARPCMPVVRTELDSLVRVTSFLYEKILMNRLERNMYLAEDRILCFEIVTKKHESWV